MHIAVHYAEIGLKGRNRPLFEGRLLGNLQRALDPLARSEPARLRRLYGRLLIELPDDVSFDQAAQRIREVFGVAHFGRAICCTPEPEEIEKETVALLAKRRPGSFGIRVRRIEKRHPFSSQSLATRLGSAVQAATGARVDLGNPEVWVDVHVLSDQALIRAEQIPGPGGMPVGCAGPVAALLSGGIDSPVASLLALKRGCSAVFVHFHSHPFTSAASQAKVRDLVALLARYQGRSRLFLVPFGKLQQDLVRDTPPGPRIVLYRRFMLRITEKIARQCGAHAMVTGDSLSQVSSQTLSNLDTINRAATLPVLRPLIGLDKAEIIERAKAMGSYEISIEPDDDCCSYLMPRRPATRTLPTQLEQIERKLDVDGLVEAALTGVEEQEISAAYEGATANP